MYVPMLCLGMSLNYGTQNKWLPLNTFNWAMPPFKSSTAELAGHHICASCPPSKMQTNENTGTSTALFKNNTATHPGKCLINHLIFGNSPAPPKHDAASGLCQAAILQPFLRTSNSRCAPFAPLWPRPLSLPAGGARCQTAKFISSVLVAELSGAAAAQSLELPVGTCKAASRLQRMK